MDSLHAVSRILSFGVLFTKCFYDTDHFLSNLLKNTVMAVREFTNMNSFKFMSVLLIYTMN